MRLFTVDWPSCHERCAFDWQTTNHHLLRILRCEIQCYSLIVGLSCCSATRLALLTGRVGVLTHLQRRPAGQTPLLPKSHAPSSLHQSLLVRRQWRQRVLCRYLTLFMAVFRQEGSAGQGADRTPFKALTRPQLSHPDALQNLL